MDRTGPAAQRRHPAVTWTVLALLGLVLAAPAASADPGDCFAGPHTCGWNEVIQGPELPDVELPDVPDVDLPLPGEVPDVEVPDAEVPDAEVPDVEVPDVEVPDMEVPDVPDVQSPDAPDVEVPDAPDVEAPETPEVPDPELPEPELPDEPVVQGPGVPTGGHGGGGNGGGGAGVPEVGIEHDDLPLYPTALGSLKTDGSATGSGDKVKSRTLQDVPRQFAAEASPPDLPANLGPKVAVPATRAEKLESPAPTGFRTPTAADVLRFAAATAERFAFPLALTLAVIFFLAIERRIDRRDPKLAAAPVVSEYESFE